MAERRSFYITTPIYFVNDVPHIGHAYTTLACDVIARFKRLDGFDVLFLTGTDEHGQKVEKSAAAAGEEPIKFCDRVSMRFRELAAAMNISNDQFIRTTEPRHQRSVQELWRRLDANGQIYLGSYAGWYSVRDETFFTDSELDEGEGGERLAPTGAPVEWVEEPSYFFKLSEWQDRLLEFYDSNPQFVLPKSRLNEVRSFVERGLNDLSISRTSFSWGIPVPGDDDHIMYVWIDALTNYITAAGFPDEDAEAYRTYWPADIHMVGKDILRFHAIFWPAFLMAAGLAPPKRVFAHGWWVNEGQKISKSLGNVIDPFALLEEFGLDPLRYFLMREVPFGNDGNFSRKAFIHRMNGDLANDLGNLAQRTLTMIARNADGRVPEASEMSMRDQELLDGASSLLERCRAHMEVQAIHAYLETVWSEIARINGYISREEPWSLKKTDPERMAPVLYVTAEALRNVAIMLLPVMPDAMAKMLDLLAVPAEARSFADIGPDGGLKPGAELPPPAAVFPRWVEDESTS